MATTLPTPGNRLNHPPVIVATPAAMIGEMAGRAAAASDTAHHWGSRPEERARAYPCDAYLEDPADVYFRAIDVEAPAPVVFRWLCQLRLAPYSYDWLDNFGRRSPRELRAGIEELTIGDRFMTIFDLVEFERDRHITLQVRRLRRLFGEAVVTYMVMPSEGGGSRLIVKLLLGGSRRGGPIRALRRQAMPWLELFMMRKQLTTLRDLAERTSLPIFE